MTLVERMDIFRLLYLEKQNKSKIAFMLDRKPSTISRELEKGSGISPANENRLTC
jgi:IS30 family transposase